MPKHSPYTIALTEGEREELESRAREYTAPYFRVVRAKMILLVAAGVENKDVAERLDVQRHVVSKWRKRFFEQRLDGLEDQARPGRPRLFPPGGRGADQGARV